jgi:hypothetical protein
MIINLRSKLNELMITIKLFPCGLLLCVESLEHLVSHLVSHLLLFLKFFVVHWVFGTLKAVDVYVNREESHWLDATFDRHSVDLSAAFLHLIGHDIL